MTDDTIHPAFFEKTMPIYFRLEETAYFLEQMRIFQGKARKAQEAKRPPKMVENRTIFTYNFSAFLSSAYSVREVFARATDGDAARKQWLQKSTATSICQFFGKLRELNTHRSVVAAGMSFRSKMINGMTQFDLGVVFGQTKSNKYMSPLFFSIDSAALDKSTSPLFHAVDKVEGPTFAITTVAAKYLDELISMTKEAVSLGYIEKLPSAD